MVNLGTIPIPFILDTGAPGGVYLGTEPVRILHCLNVLKEVITSKYPYLLKDATLSHGEKKINPVFATSQYPHEREAGVS